MLIVIIFILPPKHFNCFYLYFHLQIFAKLNASISNRGEPNPLGPLTATYAHDCVQVCFVLDTPSAISGFTWYIYLYYSRPVFTKQTDVLP